MAVLGLLMYVRNMKTLHKDEEDYKRRRFDCISMILIISFIILLMVLMLVSELFPSVLPIKIF